MKILGQFRTSRLLAKMRNEWDRRAHENSRHYVANGQKSWTDEEFYQSGEDSFEADILSDMGNVCQGKDPRQMSVFEIGCGAGRVTMAFAKRFGELYAVDVSGEMVRQARRTLNDFPNVHIHQNNGADLKVVPRGNFDFAYSTAVFHHIRSWEAASVRRAL